MQVSGPAAGLAVLVFEVVREHGMAMLGPILLLAGLLQVLAGRFKLGCWFRVTAPAVVYCMLAGIGVLIVLSQVHVMFDGGPKQSGLDNLIGFPATLIQAIGPGTGLQAGMLGLSTIVVMWLWDKWRPTALRFVPGALPMTGVIVRSSANVQAGASTRLSAVFHGVWLLAFVLLLSSVLQSIPVASLAGVLVYTGLKLVDLKAFRGLGRYGRMPMFTYAATAVAIIFTDLLTGVLIGFGLTLAKLAWKASRLKASLVDLEAEGEMELRLMGAATFLKVPALTRILGTVPHGSTVHVPLNNLSYIDHSCLELLEEWGRANAATGSRLIIEPRGLKRRLEGRLRTTAGVGSG